MPTLQHLAVYFKNSRIPEKKPVYLLAIVIFFWALFDGVITYISPIVMVDSGLSKTLMGIILGTSSIAGALFDFIACRMFRNTHYRKLFLIMFAICAVLPFILYGAHSFVMFIIAMALWGIYYDLRNIGSFNFISTYTKTEEHSDGFGVLSVFSSIGYLVAPIVVGFLIADAMNWKPFILAWIFLALSVIFFLILSLKLDKQRNDSQVNREESPNTQRTTWSEVILWGHIGKILFPVLLLTFVLNFIDSFFWTIGPLIADSLGSIEGFGGIFMTIYALPPLLIGWIVGVSTRKFGKKRTSFFSLLLGSAVLSLFAVINNPFVLLLDIFFASLFFSLAFPAINGAYADYISETREYEKEIEGLEDFYTNFGYIIGPIIAGFAADQLGNTTTFSWLGIVGMFVAIAFILVTPKSIDVRKQLGKEVVM